MIAAVERGSSVRAHRAGHVADALDGVLLTQEGLGCEPRSSLAVQGVVRTRRPSPSLAMLRTQACTLKVVREPNICSVSAFNIDADF